MDKEIGNMDEKFNKETEILKGKTKPKTPQIEILGMKNKTRCPQ